MVMTPWSATKNVIGANIRVWGTETTHLSVTVIALALAVIAVMWYSEDLCLQQS